MTTERIIEVNPQQFGIEPAKASELIGNLPQIQKERDVLTHQYDEVIALDINDSATPKRAKQLRSLIRDNRTKGIEVWHKTTKDFFLKGGQFVDAIKRKEVAINERMEWQLEQIEKHFEIQETKRKTELKAERIGLLRPYLEVLNPAFIDLENMDEAAFNLIILGAKIQVESIMEAEIKAEADRIAREKAEAEERERIRIENESLKAEAELKEKQLAKERAKVEAERKVAEEKARKEKEAAEAQLLEERKKAEAEAIKIKAEADAKLKVEQAERAKVEAELKAKQDAEKAEQDRIAKEAKAKADAEIKLAKAGDKKRLQVWLDTHNRSMLPFESSTIKPESVSIYKNINEKYDGFMKWANEQINSLC